MIVHIGERKPIQIDANLGEKIVTKVKDEKSNVLDQKTIEIRETVYAGSDPATKRIGYCEKTGITF